MKRALFLLMASFLTGMGGCAGDRNCCNNDCSSDAEAATASPQHTWLAGKAYHGRQSADAQNAGQDSAAETGGPQYAGAPNGDPRYGGMQCPPGQDPGGYEGGGYGAGPPTAAVTYPYYTTRGPRDFLMNDPRGLGPN